MASHGGELTPDRVVAGARAAGLDFLAATEHNRTDTYDDWRRHADDLLVIGGQEVTTETGHWLALGIPRGLVVDWHYGVRDGLVGRQLDEVHRAGGLCVAAHPHAPYPSGTFRYPYQGFDVVEVWNGPWTSDLPWQADNEAALSGWARGLAAGIRRGSWRPAMGNSDTHLENQIGVPHTVVLADGLTPGAILGGRPPGRAHQSGHLALNPPPGAAATHHPAAPTILTPAHWTTPNRRQDPRPGVRLTVGRDLTDIV